MYIGKISELTGATRKAIRHYESIGLIPVPERVGKYRVYTNKDITLINMIKRAQTVGFTLAELTELVDYKAKHNKFPIAIANNLIIHKRQELCSEMARIAKQHEELSVLQEEIESTFSSFLTLQTESTAANA